MDLNNIKRNQLDYILTDILPTELSERFTFFYFYEFLMTKRKELKQMNNFLVSVKINIKQELCLKVEEADMVGIKEITG